MKLYVDLNGNFLCPFQVLIDINAQLPKPIARINADAFAPICELNTINDWINLESLGKPPALKAKILSEAQESVEVCSKSLAMPTFRGLSAESMDPVDKPRGVGSGMKDQQGLVQQLQTINDPIELHVQAMDGVLTVDNLYALLLLSQSLSLIFYFYVASEKTEQLKKTLSPLLEQKNLVIHFKQATIEDEKLEQKRNQLLTKMGFHFGSSQTNVSPKDIPQLIGYAWVCHKAGAYELGTNALARALNASELPEPLHETLFMQLQLTRFLSHQYEAVTQAQYPDKFHFLKEEDVVSLHFITAYSATLTRNLNVAAIHFKKCHVDEHMTLTDENSLYRLNLYALFLVLQNKADVSMTLELRIQDYIAAHQINVVGLKYVNFINIARLYKKFTQYEDALNYYTKAYNEISGCGYTPSDHIYFNMNLGSLHEAAGNPETALLFWVKAAIHWLSYKNQYALSWRPRLILCQEKITDILKPLSIDKANHFLYEKIEHLIQRCGVQLSADTLPTIQFTTEQSQVNETCYATKDIVLYGSSESDFEQRLESSTQLNHLVAQFIKQSLKIKDNHNSLRIDLQNEFHPQSADQCWILANLADSKDCYYNNQALHYDGAQTNLLLTQTLAKLATTIVSVKPISTGLQIIYNRSFLNKTIEAADEVQLIQRLNSEKGLAISQLDSEMRSTLASLIRKKVVMIIFPSVSCGQSESTRSLEHA